MHRVRLPMFAAIAIVSCSAITVAQPASPPGRGVSGLTAGFEASEGYSLGSIRFQNGWFASPGDPNAFTINSDNPFSGSQHLRITRNWFSGGTSQLAASPDLGARPPGPSSTSLMINISNFGGANYDISGQALTQGRVAWRVDFHSHNANFTGPGTIRIHDRTPLGVVFHHDTGIAWNQGVYSELRVEMNDAANTIHYYYDGSLIYTSASGLFGATNVERVVIGHDNFQAPGQYADFDNLTIVPAPPAVAFLGTVLAMTAGRRRSRADRSGPRIK